MWYKESEFSLGQSFVNNYLEYPQAAAWDADDDLEDDIYKKYVFKDFENFLYKNCVKIF